MGLEQDIGLGLGLRKDIEFWTFGLELGQDIKSGLGQEIRFGFRQNTGWGLGLGQDIDLVWVRARSIGFRLGLRQDIRFESGSGQDLGFNRLHLISNLP